MKAKLILLDNPIIVSDEEIKEGDWYYTEPYSDLSIRTCVDSKYDFTYCKKIIAGLPGLPQINWNNLEEQFGYVDVGKLANEEHKYNHKSVNDISFKLGFIEGFKAAQQLKRFSLEDMKEATTRIINWIIFQKNSEITIESKLNEIIQSLSQPKIFSIEIEKEVNLDGKNGLDRARLIPKITNNQITIIRKL